MDYIELQEIGRVLQSHEEMIQSNKTSIFFVTSKVHDSEQQLISQIASIIHTLVQLNHKISTLEVECNMIRNLVLNLCKDVEYGASNQRLFVNPCHGELKEEDIVH